MATEAFRKKLAEIISQGLTRGLGEPAPGKMCIEAAIVFARGDKFSDIPKCVATPDRVYAIRINDAAWSSDEARAKALLPLALASLDTAGTDRTEWMERLVIGTVRKVLPIMLRRIRLEAQASACELVKDLEEARAAVAVAYAAAAARAAVAAAVACAGAAHAATATRAAVGAAATATRAAAPATRAADAVAYAAATAATATRAADADAAAAAAYRYADRYGDEVLRASVQVALAAYAAEGRR